MTGFVHAESMGYALDSAPNANVFFMNDQACSEANINFANDGYHFELTFGSCGMSVSNVDDSIVFETILRQDSIFKFHYES